MPTNEGTAVVTILARNYLAHARVLARSLAQHHADVPLFVVLGDEAELTGEPFRVIPLQELEIPRLRRFLFRYDRQQLLTALKPYAMRLLLDRGFERVLFLDADVLVTGDLSPVLAPVGKPSIWLTPHLLEPPSGDDRAERELRILSSGAYNGGCVGVSRSNEARRFLRWWQDRLYTHSRRAVAQGMFYDQKWLDHVPVFFDGVAIVRDPACNVAYWNVSERHVEPRFFHFSGFDPRETSTMSIHAREPIPEALAPLFERYARELDAAAYDETHALPWAYDTFANGVVIPDFVRAMQREFDGDPFESAYRWLQSPVDDRAPIVTSLWDAIYRARRDLQQAFPDHLGTDRARFIEWTTTSGLREHAIPDAFAIPLPIGGASVSPDECE